MHFCASNTLKMQHCGSPWLPTESTMKGSSMGTYVLMWCSYKLNRYITAGTE